MKERSEIEKTLKELKPLLVNKFKVKRIGIFGSYIRGEESGESDLDILVEFSEQIGWEFVDFKEYLEDILESMDKEEIRDRYSVIPWKRMMGLRNIMIHDYFGIDLGIVWKIASSNLSETKQNIVKLLKDFDKK